MIKNSSKILFMAMVMMGTMISVSSSSWLSAWMGLEINLLAFIPLMTSHVNMMSSESSLKYFLTQALASSVLMFSTILMMLNLDMVETSTMGLSSSMILSSLLLKSGAAPFHFWFPSVMEGLSWMNALLLMTWQKIAPMMLMSYVLTKEIIITSIILSVMVGSIGGLNQTSLRKIMAFSSINHLGWLMAAIMSGENLWTTYFLFYSLLSSAVVLMFNSSKMLHINQLFSTFSASKTAKFSTMVNLLSLGGLPPFLGFLPKWLVIQHLTISNNTFLMTAMTVMTLITLYYYIRICYSAFMLNHQETGWMVWTYNSSTASQMNLSLALSLVSTSGLFMVSMMYSTL